MSCYVEYEHHQYKDYGSGYDYYGGYDQHDDYGMYGFGEPSVGRGRGGRGGQTSMPRGTTSPFVSHLELDYELDCYKSILYGVLASGGDERYGHPPQGNQELLVVRNKVGRP